MEINIFDDRKIKSATVTIIADSSPMDQMLERVLSPAFRRVDKGASLTVVCKDSAPPEEDGPCIFIGSRPNTLRPWQIFMPRPLSIEEFFKNAVEIIKKQALHAYGWGIDPSGGIAVIGDRRISLTPKEAELYRLLLSRVGNCVERGEIDSVLWSGGSAGNCADVYVCYLRKKLEKIAGPGVLISVRGRGYMLKNP